MLLNLTLSSELIARLLGRISQPHSDGAQTPHREYMEA